jgi:hypothetical protein
VSMNSLPINLSLIEFLIPCLTQPQAPPLVQEER